MIVRTRIAPSPTGYPHIGTMFQALFDYVYAKQNSGNFVIRIEDTDRGRYVNGAEEAIYRALEWLKIVPDEGPKYGGNYGPYRQSERLEIYKKHALELIDRGYAYYCFCSAERLEQVRREKQTKGLPPMYDRCCRDMNISTAQKRAESESYVIRMKIPDGEKIEVTDLVRGKIVFSSETVDDQVLLKSDGYPTYHLAVVVDDHLMGITHIVRGEEWISSTPKHVLLYRYFGWQIPNIFHTPLLRNPDKSKLSKRHGHSAVSWYKDQGYLPEVVINFLASRVWNHPEGKEIFGIDDLVSRFKFKDMHILGPVVDLKKLDWMNGVYIRNLSEEELIKRLEPFRPNGLSTELMTKVLPLIKERLVRLSDLESLTKFFYEDPVVNKDFASTKTFLSNVANLISQLTDWQVGRIETELRRLQQESGLKPREAFMALRDALTGMEATPPLFDVMWVLGKETCERRLNSVH